MKENCTVRRLCCPWKQFPVHNPIKKNTSAKTPANTKQVGDMVVREHSYTTKVWAIEIHVISMKGIFFFEVAKRESAVRSQWSVHVPGFAINKSNHRALHQQLLDICRTQHNLHLREMTQYFSECCAYALHSGTALIDSCSWEVHIVQADRHIPL